MKALVSILGDAFVSGSCASAASTLALAAAVDLRCTPERLTPGFERRIKAAPLSAVYLAFGIGLAISALLHADSPD